jgi:hypothetical protein
MSADSTSLREALMARLREAERGLLEAGKNHSAAQKQLQAEGYPAMWQGLQQSMAEVSRRREEIRALKDALLRLEPQSD